MSADDFGGPVCTIIGGPNGAGKSTIYNRFALQGVFISADVIARGLNPENPEASSMAAGRRTLAELARILQARKNFVYETTLSSRQSLQVMLAAKDAGYLVGLVFVALNSAELNVQRVAERVARGGHHIAEVVIRRRYETSLRRLVEALRIVDVSMLLDNSALTGPQLLMQTRAASIIMNNLDEAYVFHYRIAEAVGEAFSMATDAVFLAR